MYNDKRQDDENPNQKRRDRHALALLGVELTGLIVVVVAVGMMVGSCAQNQDEVTSGTATQSSAQTQNVVAASASQAPPQSPEGDNVLSPDSLPPEVTASVNDTLVTPGSAIEINAEASVDATDLSLRDGLGRRQPFAYDETGKVWRTHYRVPFKSADRLGLSVTAKNEAGRWRRVWIFLHVDRGTSTPADSTQ
jgi:hypothetical protein